MRQGFTPVPTSIAGLRGLQLCSERATTGARAIVDRIKPTKKPRLVANPSQLTYDLYNDRCDAIVFDAPRPRRGARRGTRAVRAVRGSHRHTERYGIAFPKGSPLRASVNAALSGADRDGTMARLQKRWLTADVAKLRVLR